MGTLRDLLIRKGCWAGPVQRPGAHAGLRVELWAVGKVVASLFGAFVSKAVSKIVFVGHFAPATDWAMWPPFVCGVAGVAVGSAAAFEATVVASAAGEALV